MIYTGYYSKTKHYQEKGIYTIGISGKVPDFYEGEHWKDLAPRFSDFREWRKGNIDNMEYVQRYKSWLNTLDISLLRERFENLIKEHKNIILLCYEKPETFCHRHVLADWIEENVKFRVEEYRHYGKQ